MILKASERSGARNLANHLMNTRDNEHVELHELRGFVADDLDGALQEAHAISRGTRCKNFLFSLSLSPPEQADVPDATFEAAIEQIEQELGLTDQPRAIVFHEKEGRRHAHAVWSRIDPVQMKAIQLSHYKRKLNEIARQLYLEHGWDMPEGFKDQDALISDALRDSRLRKRSGDMSDLYWLTDAQMARLEPFFPKSHGKPRVDDKRVLSGIIFINRNGLRWRDAPKSGG